MNIAIVQALKDFVTLSKDDSDEAAMGECGFSEDEMALAPPAEVEDLDETD